MDNLLTAIDVRRSRRNYVPKPLGTSDGEAIQSLISKFNDEQNLNMQLITGNGDAFEGFRRTYGFFSGVQNYVAFVGNAKDVLEMEKYGYFGELLILEATLLGLGTCWVGGTFDRKSTPIELSDEESITCVITIGNVPSDLSTREKFIKKITHRRRSKTIEEMTVSDEELPEWFLSGMRAVQKAPSAVNRQPVKFTYRDEAVTAAVDNTSQEGFAFDLGIAKLHFEIGAGGGVWEFGNGGAFIRKGSGSLG